MFASAYISGFVLALSCSSLFGSELRLNHQTKQQLLTADINLTETGKCDQRIIHLPEFTEFCLYAPDDARFPAGANRLFPWVGKDNLHEIAEQKDILMGLKADRRYQIGLFKLKQGNYLCLLALPSHRVCSWFEPLNKQTQSIILKTDSLGNGTMKEQRALLGAIGTGATAMQAVEQAWAQAFSSSKFSQYAQPRIKKNYPEMFHYLGWCSWEQYKFDINKPLLTWAFNQLNQSPVPVRWMLIDDGFQNIKDQKLVDFQTNVKKFPQGMAFLPKLKNDKIKWMGVWNCYYGYWQGISPQHQLSQEAAQSLVPCQNIKRQGNQSLVTGKNATSTQDFYRTYMAQVKRDGYDFVKIDGQADYLDYIERQFPNPVEMTNWCSHSLEQSCKQHQLALTNCMTLGPVTMFRSLHSTISRCSVDYKLNHREMAHSHLWQSYANGLWMFPLVWPDHDMFHSSDPLCGRMMAVSKALSGGPIYLSDKPDQLNKENISPLIKHDGTILRPLTTAIPLSDSLMMNPKKSDKPYRVAARLPNNGIALAAYHWADKKLHPQQTGTITAKDIEEILGSIPSKGMVYWDYYGNEGGKLNKQGHTFTLKEGEDRLFLMAPVQSGWAILGAQNKFLPQCMIQKSPQTDPRAKTITFTMEESGPILIWSQYEDIQANPSCTIKFLGNGFHTLEYPLANTPLKVSLTHQR